MQPLAWMDVISPDIATSLAFYATAFGWTSTELPLDHGEGYRAVLSEGAMVAGAEEVAAERNLTPTWTLMIEADEARTCIDAAVEAGADETFVLSPMLELGSIAMVRDSWGATLGVWQPDTFRPSDVPQVPGRLAGGVLLTPDTQAATDVHRDLYGWRATEGDAADLDAGLPVFVEEAAGPARWIPVLQSNGATLPAGALADTSPRLASLGLRRYADPMGAEFYVLP